MEFEFDYNYNKKGVCSCGSLRYRRKDNPMFVNACHCNLCKQQIGSTFITNAFIENSNFKVTNGKLKSHQGSVGSGNPYEVDRCKECSVAIISYYWEQRNLGVVKVGTLDQAGKFPPNTHLFVKNKVSWLEIPKGILTFQEKYDIDSTWRKESLQRLKNGK